MPGQFGVPAKVGILENNNKITIIVMSDLFLLKNLQIIDLFEIKINDFEGYLRFHGSKNFNKDLIFKDAVYLYIPSEISNLEYSSDGKQSRPTLSISNVNNFISLFIKDRNDLLGCRFFRKKILAKDLDDINFDPSGEGKDKNNLGVSSFRSFVSTDSFVIQKKSLEQKDKVDFVLDAVTNFGGITYATNKMFAYRDEALEILHSFPASEVREALEELVRYTTDRKY